MDAMRNLNSQGFIDDEHMEKLEAHHRDLTSGAITQAEFWKRTGVSEPGLGKHRNKPVANRFQLKKKRKAQRLAKKKARA